jgi:hypothetical protein
MSDEQLQILQHALGVDEYGQGEMYRNHFCAGASDEPNCRELVALGYAEQFERSYLPYFNVVVTEAGKHAMREASPKPPKLSRGQKRYREFLHADTGRPFIEWLRDQREATHD